MFMVSTHLVGFIKWGSFFYEKVELITMMIMDIRSSCHLVLSIYRMPGYAMYKRDLTSSLGEKNHYLF